MPVQPALEGASPSDFSNISDAECFCIARVIEAAVGVPIAQLIKVNTQHTVQHRLQCVLAGMRPFIQRRKAALAVFRARVPARVWRALANPATRVRPSRRRAGVFRVGKLRVRATSMGPLQACHALLTVDYDHHVAGVRESRTRIADLARKADASVAALIPPNAPTRIGGV